jgi:hypothetical protein
MAKRKKPKPAATRYDPTPEEIEKMTAEIRKGWIKETPRTQSEAGSIKREHKLHNDISNFTEEL